MKKERKSFPSGRHEEWQGPRRLRGVRGTEAVWSRPGGPSRPGLLGLHCWDPRDTQCSVKPCGSPDNYKGNPILDERQGWCGRWRWRQSLRLDQARPIGHFDDFWHHPKCKAIDGLKTREWREWESGPNTDETLLFAAGWLLCSLQLRQMSSDRLVILLKWPNLETCILQIMLHEAS